MKKVLKITGISTLIFTTIFLIIAAIFLGAVIKETKDISVDKEKLLYGSTSVNIYDNNDKLISASNADGKKLIEISKLSDETKQAFISIEDKNFYKHHGINTKRMIKALFNNIKAGKIVEGASTITQQLVKNTHLSNEKTLKRKVKEIFLAKKIESNYTKDEILEIYLNVIYFGNGNYGIQEAANYYFGIDADKLTLDQSCMLAGIIKSPNKYDPVNNHNNAISRRNLVLHEMLKDGKITKEKYDDTISKDTPIEIYNIASNNNDLYLKATLNEARKILQTTDQDIVLNKYKIYTYYNDENQTNLVNAINNNDNYELNSFGNIADGLGIIINNKNGGIEAYAGKSKYNLVDIKRQPGSAIKPILVYAPALDNGTINPMTQILDESIDIDGYMPHNVGGESNEYVSITQSVAKSLNIPAIKVMQYVGIDKSKCFASNAGITFSDKDNGYAIALGGLTDGITLQQLAGSYLPFARGGNYVSSGFIKKITTQGGITIYQKDEKGKVIMGSDTSYLMTQMLKEGVNSGTSKRLNTLPYDIAGKTGTVAVKGTNYNTDAISIAYTNDHTFGVTLFDYSNDSKYYLEGSNNGGTYCTSILKQTIDNTYKTSKPSQFSIPNEVEQLSIDLTELHDNHIVAIATENTPTKFVQNGYFSKRYLPTTTSFRFDNPTLQFNIQNIDGKNIIVADLQDYFDYKLFRDNEEIDSITNYNGEYTYKDVNIADNKMYEYHFEIINTFNNKSYNSESKTIITKNKYDILMDNEMVKSGISWYFG